MKVIRLATMPLFKTTTATTTHNRVSMTNFPQTSRQTLFSSDTPPPSSVCCLWFTPQPKPLSNLRSSDRSRCGAGRIYRPLLAKMDGSRQIPRRLNHCYDLLGPSALFSYADDGGGSSSEHGGWGTFHKETGDLAAGIDAGVVLGAGTSPIFLQSFFWGIRQILLYFWSDPLRVYCKP